MGSPIVPELAAVRAMQTSMGKLKTAHEDLRADLADALDGWEALAGASDQARIDALRKRWELEAADRSVGEQDLTDGTAES
ncbi:MAG TPA: hypothetical protein VLB44_01210 [Kofleriaceae bacterium]|nr:hypothetical protein [Kofleriaceae bacterium]